MRSGRKSSQRTVLLPWERKQAWLVELRSGRRLRAAAFLLLTAGLTLWAFAEADARSKVRQTRAAIAEAQRAVATFRTEIGRCPRSTLELVHPPKSGARYLDETPVDGWDRELLVRCPGRDNPTSADVISAGPSGSFATDDNIL